ncbi:MAG: polysaccharide deacetylase family protein, partial [Myxococcota bacterium]
RVQAVVAILGALRGRHRAVDNATKNAERLSTSARANQVAELYFDAVLVPDWASAAVIAATDAGMVILGQDRLGVDTGRTRILRPSENATRADVAAMLYGALNYPRGYNFGASPPPARSNAFANSAITNGNLLPGEFVLTFDDGPRASSAQLATLLRNRGVTGLFFAVSSHLGSKSGNNVTLNTTHHSTIRAILDNGHILANHSHNHCIGGSSACGGKSFAQLSRSDALRQIELPHAIMSATIAKLGHSPRNKLLHFFRSPGNSWSSSAAEHVRYARIPDTYFGPIAWDLPVRGEEDFRCWSQGMSVSQCAQRYLSAVDRGEVTKGVILVHDNFEQATELTRMIIDGLHARGMRFVHPRCIIGCTR